MKPKLSPLCRASFVVCLLALSTAPCALSQVPQGFNYQAIARDGITGNPITDPVNVKIAILADDSPEDVLWEEQHSGVDPDDHGLFSIVVGGGVYESGPVLTFDGIDWTVTPKYIRTMIYYGGSWKNMGSAQLWSVPYAMVADSLSGPLKNLTVKGTAETSDTEALFEVKNTTGQTVFAVYNEGVRIYVNDQDAKGPKGGFAIGGFGMGKTIPHQYMFISGDSVRFNIDNGDEDKGPKGGFAIGGFGTVKGLTQKYLMISNDSVRIYVDNSDTDKGPKGGFAIGGYGAAKGKPQDLLTVSNDSVRIYLDKAATDKGPKGGFAIGGYGTTKGEEEEYLRVTRDSTRVYVNEDASKGTTGGFAIGGYGIDNGKPQKLLTVSNDSVRIYINDGAKGPKGGFAIGGFDQSKGSGNNVNFFNVSTSADDTISQSQNRILWYPVKNAFLTGRVLIELPDSVGENSFATGFESKAIGRYSQALGYQAIARRDYSTAIGYQAVANNINSFAFGQWATAKNQESYAFGRGAIAEGFRSYAFGSAGIDSAGAVTGVAYAKGDYAFAIGQGSQALGNGSFTLGIADTAIGEFSVAIGYKTKAIGDYSTVMGLNSTASRVASTALGNRTVASGDYSIAMGYYSQASGTASTSMGSHTVSIGNYSTAMGYYTSANGTYATAIGYKSTAGIGATSLGYNNNASGSYSTALGHYTTASGYASTAIGNHTTASNDYATAMGDYTNASGSYSTAIGYYSTASGRNSFAMGSSVSSPSGRETAMGTYNLDYTPETATGWNDNDRLFVIGNGITDDSRSNAVTILKDGRIGLQTVVSPTYALQLPNNSSDAIGEAIAYAWRTYSDGRVKTDRSSLVYGLSEILRLEPQGYFQHNSITDENHIKILEDGSYEIGLIAQEVYQIIPEAVRKPDNENSELWSLSYDILVPVLIKGIQEQQAQIEAMKVIISRMEEKIASLSP